MNDAVSAALSLPPSTIPMIAGYSAFASSLALSTLLQLKLLGVSTGSPRPIPSLIGMASVALSSLASHNACIKAHGFLGRHRRAETRQTTPIITAGSSTASTVQEAQPWKIKDSLEFGSIQVENQTLRVCALGMLAFKLLGGRFWAVAPSSYTHLGSFARFSLPATEKYATASQRAALERLGRWVGCHTCGSHMLFRNSARACLFHGDHQPPKAVAQQLNAQWFRFGTKVKFRFFPQCVNCSNVQGKLLSTATNDLRGATSFWNAKPNLKHAGGGQLAYFHGWRFRPFHLAGAVIAAVTVVDASTQDVQDGNRKRFHHMQVRAQDCYRNVNEYIRNVINR